MNKENYIAVFGDLHGRILLAFWLVRRWQEEHGREIDHILCTGDVGVYKDFTHMDRASRRYADKFPEELGFSKYFWNLSVPSLKLMRHPAADAIFHDVISRLYFVSGNHEDHSYIGDIHYNYAYDLQDPIAVDIDWEGGAKGCYGGDEFKG